MVPQGDVISPPSLSARQLIALRCRSDRFGIIVLLIATSAGLLFLPGALPAAIILAVFILLVLFEGALLLARLLSNSVPVGKRVRSSWDNAANIACASTGVSRRSFALHLVQDPRPNAFSVWSLTGRAVIVTSGLAALLEDDTSAQVYIVGHEVGHLLYHFPYAGIVNSLYLLPGPFGVIARFGSLGWSRASERTADRLGLAICGSPKAAARALLALSIGVKIGDADLIPTLAALPRRPLGVWGYLAEALATHPFLRPRIEAIFSFAASNAFDRAVGLHIAEQARWDLSEMGLRPDRQGGVWPN